MPTPPNTIFKYESFKIMSLQNLKAQSIYFASPLQFNDPFDCAITASIAEPTVEEIESMKRFYLNNPNAPESLKSNLRSLPQDEIKRQFVDAASNALISARQDFLSSKGVSCFSERNNDLLMWSHYGGRYKGFCLEFRTQYEPFTKLRKVRYEDDMPTIGLASFLVDKNREQFLKNSEQFLDIYCTKSSAWSYEYEWRAFHNTAGTLFTYEAPALKAVYFGPDIEPLAREIVCLVLGGQNPDVEFWRGTRSATKFKIEFESVTYTPHIVAKKMGLV